MKQLLCLAGIMLSSCTALASDLPRGSHSDPRYPATPPASWTRFCTTYRGECDTPAADQRRQIKLDQDTVAVLQRIAARVDRNMSYETDMRHWGVEDQWDLPTDGRGDCEDSALQKRHEMIAAGFPPRALLVTIVMDGPEGHALLTVVTDRGDMTLDNISHQLTPADQLTGYRFIQRQDPDQLDHWRRWDRGY